ncbi:MAG: hypothetical protein AAFY60_18635, partial [Myxococcota bacterium]
FFRDVATLAWAGSEIEEEAMNLSSFVDHLLSDEPLESYFETQAEGRFLACTPDAFDVNACQDAVDMAP